MNSNKLALLLCAAVPLLLRAEELPLLEGEKAEASVPVHPDDSAKVLKRFSFDAGTEGWNSEQDEAYKPWSKCESSPDGFRGSAGALKTTIPNQWGSLGPFVAFEYPGAGTHVTVAYKTTKCKGIACQGKVTAIKKQLHGAAPSFSDGVWTVDSFETEKWAPWSGGELGKDHTFSTLMVYAESADPHSEYLLDDVVIWSGKDTTPPDKVRRASGSVELDAGNVVLKWKAPDDNIAVAKFEIHRSISPNFTPSAKTLIGTTADTIYRDGALNNFGTYYYRIVAEDASGNSAEASLPLKVDVKE